MDTNTDWLKAAEDFLAATTAHLPFGTPPEPLDADATVSAVTILGNLVEEVTRDRAAKYTPAGQAPVETRSQEWVEGIMTKAVPSQVKALTNAMMRSASREEANFASQLVAGCYAIAAAVKGHPDPSAAVFATTVIIMGRLIQIGQEEELRANPPPPPIPDEAAAQLFAVRSPYVPPSDSGDGR